MFRSSNFELLHFLQKINQFFKNKATSSEVLFIEKQTLGAYLLLRLCNALRVRYFWYDKEQDGNLSYRENETLNSDKTSFYADVQKALKEGFYCINALLPLEYNYFQARSFGSYSCIPGLNFIFRGGLLPFHKEGKTHLVLGGPGSGKTTYALQRMVEIAFYGGLSIYFSFEENYELILDRLNSFRLVNVDHFEISEVNEKNIKKVINDFKEKNPNKGLLLLYNFSETFQLRSISKTIDDLGEIVSEYKQKWCAITIDSINSLQFRTGLEMIGDIDEQQKRIYLKDLLHSIRANRFLGLILSEKDDSNFTMLPYLCDVALELNNEQNGRTLQIIKARNQNFQAGKHPFRISDGTGMITYPSLASVLSTLRHRMNSTLSEERVITLPKNISKNLKFDAILEKSMTLIEGPALSGKTVFLLHLITANSLYSPIERSKGSKKTSNNAEIAPNNIFIVTFKTPENRYNQKIRAYGDLSKKWASLNKKTLRWFSPGTDITAEQVILTIWKVIHEAIRENNPIDRIVFEDIESAEKLIPDIKNKSLFWPTIFELISTEALTAFFVTETNEEKTNIVRELSYSMDYIFNISFPEAIPEEDIKDQRQFIVKKWIDAKTLLSHGIRESITFNLTDIMNFS